MLSKLLLLILLTFSLVNAYAHPFILESTPSNLERLLTPPDKILITFSEPVEERFSYIRVTDSNGNRVDNDDTKYLDSEDRLVVTLKPSLADDVYTVTTKVLSKVDGHIVDYTFSFIVGSAQILEEKPAERADLIYTPQSLSKFVGMVGQYIIIGSIFGSLYIWRSSREILNEALKSIHPLLNMLAHRLYIIGLVLVFISNFAIIYIQTYSLGVSIDQAINTGFGNIWLMRMLISIIIAILYLAFKKDREAYNVMILTAALVLSLTFSLIGHAAVSLAIGIDMIHNMLASVWIGSIFYLAFAAIPALKHLEPYMRNAMIALIIPRFSKLALVALGILAITGPSILAFIESDPNLLLASTYGMLLAIKLSLIAAMLVTGAFSQFVIHKRALNLLILRSNGKYQDSLAINLHKMFTNVLRIEAAIGVLVLLSISFLTTAGLPRSEFPFYSPSLVNLSLLDVDNDLPRLFNSTLVSEDASINLSIVPARVGINTFTLKVTDLNGNPIQDLGSATLKLREVDKDISPLVIELKKIGDAYIANGTINSNGRWIIEANVERTQALSISVIFDALIKPDLDEIKFELNEYAMPFDTINPIHAIYSNGYVWISDGIKPRLWRFDIESQEFKYYTFNGTSSIKLAEDSRGRIWFTDPLSRQFGYFDTAREEFRLFKTYEGGLPTDIYRDLNDNIWLALIDRDSVVRFDPNTGNFKVYRMPLNGSQPAAVAMDEFGNVWVAEAMGRLAKIDGDKIEEFGADLKEPFALLIDGNAVWISQHIGAEITRYDPLLNTFQSFRVADPKSLPYGMVKDSFGNIWFAQHILDKIGVLDPITGKIREIPISSPSWVQFLDIDDDNNIWFAEPRQSKIGMISIKTIPIIQEVEEGREEEPLIGFKYADIVIPAISGFIIVTSLLFVKATYNLRSSIKYVNRLS